MAVYPGPYLCMMCFEEPQGDGIREAPFEVDDGRHNTTKDEAWIYCKACDCWTAFAPIPDDPAPSTNREGG